ncbi:MAG: GuaB3 family IMP dehydrogenase-related protein [Candidatus Nanopelagicales bacterium]|nr:GuaB3 family IMP dehydrogenase-related protein [Candidatus Nanopelagicales bacterium]
MSEHARGRAWRGRGYTFDEVSVVPSRRTRDGADVSLRWQIDAYTFDAPIMAAPTDSVVSPASAATLGGLGVMAVLNLEGLWCRYADPEPMLSQIADLPEQEATTRLQQIYSAPIEPALVASRVAELKSSGSVTAAAVSPGRTAVLGPIAVAAGLDVLVVRGTTVSAQHVSTNQEPVNLKDFIHELEIPVIVGGCANYQSALHLMRTGAAGVLVGFGGGAAHRTANVLGVSVPMATAVTEVAEARRDYLDESGGRYVHVLADGSLGRSGHMVRALACGADAVVVGSAFARATDAPGRGFHWGPEATHPTLPRGERVNLGTVGTLAQIMNGPSHVADGTMNIVGAIRKAVATAGYTDLKEFQRVDMVVGG